MMIPSRAHPEQQRLNRRIHRLDAEWFQPFTGTVYRFVNPLFSKTDDVINGKGGLVADGRWNRSGCFPVTYTSMSPTTALAEMLSHVRYFALPTHKALPKVLVALHVQVRKSLDLRGGALRQRLSLSLNTVLTTDWIRENQSGFPAITQAWGTAFCQAGVEALVVSSAADPSGANVVIFPENLLSSSRYELLNPVNWT